MGEVWCVNCYRRERWAGGPDESEVLLEGGMRATPDAPEVVSTRIALRAHAGDLPPVVGRCSACGHPMVSDCTELAVVPTVIETPDGCLHIGPEGVVGPQGEMSPQLALTWVEDQCASWRTPTALPAGPWSVPLILFLVTPVFGLWLLCLFFFVSFLNGWNAPPI